MPIPVYRKIQLKTSKKQAVFELMAELTFETIPYVFNIKQVTNQEEALRHIEEYLRDNRIFNYPYSQYVITDLKNIKTQLLLVLTVRELPSYFERKVKSPNIKEADILNICNLKQKQLSNIHQDDINPTINDYADAQRKLYIHSHHGAFLESILNSANKDVV